MNEDAEFSTPAPKPDVKPDNSRRSPIRPIAPINEPPPRPAPSQPAAESAVETAPDNTPQGALTGLRQKMETIANEYAEGKINRAQFNAMYGRYSEQRAIIERLLERNPSSEAWKQVVGSRGHTGFLRHHFESQALYFMVYRIGDREPMMVGGKHGPVMDHVEPVIKQLWAMKNRPVGGIARKSVGNNLWLVVATGSYAVTLVMFMLEPSLAQAQIVRDLHADFERANLASLSRGTAWLDRMVFPQRSLVENAY